MPGGIFLQNCFRYNETASDALVQSGFDQSCFEHPDPEIKTYRHGEDSKYSRNDPVQSEGDDESPFETQSAQPHGKDEQTEKDQDELNAEEFENKTDGCIQRERQACCEGH